MPMPLSVIVMVRAWLSVSMRIARSASFSSSAGLAIASKRSLSVASEAFEISSRRKISLLLYRLWIIRCSSCLTSAWKLIVSCVAFMVLLVNGSRRRRRAKAAAPIVQFGAPRAGGMAAPVAAR